MCKHCQVNEISETVSEHFDFARFAVIDALRSIEVWLAQIQHTASTEDLRARDTLQDFVARFPV